MPESTAAVTGRAPALAARATDRQEPLVTRPFVCVVTALLAAYLSGTLVDPVLPLLIIRLGGTGATVGMIMGVMGLSRLLARVIAAREADRLGRRVVVTASYVLRTVAAAAYIVVPSVGPLYPIRVVDAGSSSSLDTSSTALVAEMVPASRLGAALAVIGAAYIAATAIGAAAAEGLMRSVGLTYVFVASGLLGVIGVVLTRVLRETHLPESRLTWQHAAARISAALTTPRIVLPAASFFLVNALNAALLVFVPPFAVSQGVLFFPFFVAYSAVSLALRLLMSRMIDQVSGLVVLVPSLVILGLAATLIGHARSTAMLAAAGGVYGLGYGLLYPVLIGAVARRSTDALRAASLAVFGIAMDLGTALGIAVTGQLVHAMGYVTAFTIGGLLQVVTIAIVIADQITHGERPLST